MDYDKCIEAALNAESRGKLDEAQMWATLAVAAVVDRAATEIKTCARSGSMPRATESAMRGGRDHRVCRSPGYGHPPDPDQI
jgi:hypothetical protein